MAKCGRAATVQPSGRADFERHQPTVLLPLHLAPHAPSGRASPARPRCSRTLPRGAGVGSLPRLPQCAARTAQVHPPQTAHAGATWRRSVIVSARGACGRCSISTDGGPQHPGIRRPGGPGSGHCLAGPPGRPGDDSAVGGADAQIRHSPDRIAWAVARIGHGVGFESYHFAEALSEQARDADGPAQMRTDQGAHGKPGTGRGRGPLEAIDGWAGRQGVAEWSSAREHGEAGNTGGGLGAPVRAAPHQHRLLALTGVGQAPAWSLAVTVAPPLPM